MEKSSEGNVWNNTYDNANRLTSKTDPLGNYAQQYGYDSIGNRTAAIDPLGNLTQYQYNVFDKPTTVTDPLGHVSTNVYDSLGRRIAAIDANGNVTQTGYDAVGNPVTMMNASGFISTTVYDAAYRPIARIDVFIPSKRENRAATFVPQPPASEEESCTYDLSEAMDAKMATQEGHDFYANRKCCCEPAFAMIKGCPGTGRFRQFLRRGLDKCQKDWLTICAVHNLRRYIASKSRQQPAKAKSSPKPAPIGAISLQMAL